MRHPVSRIAWVDRIGSTQTEFSDSLAVRNPLKRRVGQHVHTLVLRS